MIRHKKITDTQIAKSADIKSQIEQLVKYLIKNRNIVADPSVTQVISQTKPILATPITLMFEQCVNTDYFKEFATLHPITDRTRPMLDSVPDILTMNSIVVDLKGTPEAQPLEAYYELKDKILINAAGLIGVTDRGVQVKDLNELHSMYVRGMLTRSFSVSNGWLTPSLSSYIVKVYSLLLSSVIAKNQNLIYAEQMPVAAVLALYMSQLLMRDDEDPARPSLFFRASSFLGMNRMELEDLASKCASLSGPGLDIPKVCELIAEVGPMRLKKFNTRLFYSLCSVLGSPNDVIATQISFQYPPYFLHSILRALSQMQFGQFVYYMKQHRLLDEGKKFFGELRVARSLYDNR